jgi:peroxiredoxin
LAELRTLVGKGDKFKLIAVSVDSPEISKKLADRIARDGNGAVGYPILSDPGHKMIDSFGLFDPAYIGEEFEGIPHPAVYILDADRKVLWLKVEPDYRKRPTNQDIRAELDRLTREVKEK